MSNEVTIVTPEDMQKVIALDNTVKESHRQIAEAEKAGNNMLKAMVLANATTSIRNMLMPMMPKIMALTGSPLGFRTDRDRGEERKEKGPYSAEVVCDVVSVALLRGFQIVGNEFNIIAGNFYGTKEGFARLLRDMPGFKDFRVVIGVHQGVGDKGALVPMHATWTLDGVPDEMRCEIIHDANGKPIADRRIAVRVNSGQGADAIIGKAQSKLNRRIYEHITRSEVSSVEDAIDGDMSDVIDGTATPTQEAPTAQKTTVTTESTAANDPPKPPRGTRFKEEMSAAKNEAEARLVYDRWYSPESSFEAQDGDHERDQAVYKERLEQFRKARDERANANAADAPGTGKQIHKKAGPVKQQQKSFT